MYLVEYLKRAGVVTGPLAKNTSYSRLSNTKTLLTGGTLSFVGKEFMVFGEALHEQFLESKCTVEVTMEEQKRIADIIAALNRHPIVKSLMKDSVREEKFYFNWGNVQLAVILDIKKQAHKIGADLKTTSARNFQQFLQKARELGYFKQGVIYKRSANLQHFYFIGVQKIEPYGIFLLDVSLYPEDEAYALAELEFLLYFYENYGNIITETTAPGNTSTPAVVSKSVEVKQTNNRMSGKEALTKIQAAAKEYKKAKAAAIKATKAAEKLKAGLDKMVNKFPAKEAELYAEKVKKIVDGL